MAQHPQRVMPEYSRPPEPCAWRRPLEERNWSVLFHIKQWHKLQHCPFGKRARPRSSTATRRTSRSAATGPAKGHCSPGLGRRVLSGALTCCDTPRGSDFVLATGSSTRRSALRASLAMARQHATQQTPGQVAPLRYGQHRRARQRRGGDSVCGPRTEDSGDFLKHDSFPFQRRLALSAAILKNSAKAERPASGNFLKSGPARVLSQARRCLGQPVG